MADRAVNACSASRYLRVIQPSWSQPEQADTSTTTGPDRRGTIPATGLAHGVGNGSTMLSNAAAAASADKAWENSSRNARESPPDQEEETNERKYLYISDDSCTERSCGGRRNDRYRKKLQSRTNKRAAEQCRRVRGLDLCDDEEECYGGDDTSDGDSDSEADISDPRLCTHKQKMKKWRTLARGKFEEMLLECIVDTDNIPSNYENIFIDREVISKVERVTALGLTRPKAFNHGVLKNNKVTGAVLYGPPGTGKTLLARGVAKESGFNMLSISTSEVWQKCHGDDEKMIKAIFSMARKMYPSIVFLDEADAMLGERKAGEKRHLRAMLNKFLMEWDGIMSGTDSPFILLATNRPNDLDPAVLRRAPVRIQFNLPSRGERSGILGLLLKDETLDPEITVSTLANLTPQYTGSDLKNLCVTAATECIAEQKIDTAERILKHRHFIAAMRTVKATTISKTREQDFQNFQSNRQQQAEE